MVSLPGRDSLTDADDRTVASRAADGDIRAFEILMRRYGSLLRAYAARIVRPADADDVVQDTFVTAWQELPDLENPAAVRSWLTTIVTRKSIDRLRSVRDHESIDDHDFHDRADSPEEVASASSLDGLPVSTPVGIHLVTVSGDSDSLTVVTCIGVSADEPATVICRRAHDALRNHFIDQNLTPPVTVRVQVGRVG